MNLKKLLMIIIPILFFIFIIIWAGKSKVPTNIETSEKQTESTSAWWSGDEETTENKDINIPNNYEKVPGTENLFMEIEDDKVKNYVLRTIETDGSYTWQIFNENIPAQMQHVEGDIYKYESKDGTMYFKFTKKADGTYDYQYVEDYKENTENVIKTEVVRESKQEDGFIVVYETTIYKTYNSAGELINTRTEGPNVVSRSKDVNTADVKKDWLNSIYLSQCVNLDYVNNAENILLGLINSERAKAGFSEFTQTKDDVLYKIAQTAAGNLISTDFDYESDYFKQLEKYFPNYNIIALTLPLDLAIDENAVAVTVNDQMMKNEYSKNIRCSNVYTKCSVAIVKTDKGYVCIEVFNK